MPPSANHELYTESAGDDVWRAEVSILQDLLYRRNSSYLAVLSGANYRMELRDGVPVMRINTSLAGVVDFEHDTSKFAYIEVALATTVYEGYGTRELVGILTDARLYPAGVDPLTQSDQDTDAGECTECISPHRFAPYQPPERDEINALVGTPVLVSISPQALYDREEDDEE